MPTETKESKQRVIIPTGSAEYTKANNIYDMAGNMQEWTTEVYSTANRSCLGGYCYNNEYDAAYRTGSTKAGDNGGRAVLYIK